MKPKVLALCGATASGKTAVSFELAKILPLEIVSMDAMQVYRCMDIGTAKPTKEEQALIPHHMIDVVEPWDSYSVALYQRDARQKIDEILGRDKLPLLVGGTGMFLRALSMPLGYGGTGGDETIRRRYETYAAEHGNEALHGLLLQRDQKAAGKLHPNDVRRVVRALEVMDLTGQKFSDQKMPSYADGPYQILPFVLVWDRAVLYERINQRVDRMVESGLLDEVKNLLNMGVKEEHQSMQSIGYKEWLPYLRGESDFETQKELIKRRTRNYAKRQETWFKQDPRIIKLQGDAPPEDNAQQIKERYESFSTTSKA
ncbi:MAG TPA: tRNA (adenosine(37)-N6)-dimethylallyltransferase MiaA [Clostridiales bacterium]|jgi:tRNA dimethylallyltransferase|nr:tRNA (adenosine(37)-N6)-dimethylallyltransferase MiaA [Clostridiales bacterium]